MASKKITDLSPRELKSLKKGGSDQAFLRNKDKESPLVARPLTSTAVLNEKRSSLAPSSCSDLDVDCLTAKIKCAVVEAVQDLKAELRAEYEIKVKELNDKFVSVIERLQKDVSDLRDKIESQSSSLEKEFLYDMRDSEMRRNNIMIFGLEESGSLTFEDSKKDDLKLIQKLASELNVFDFEMSDCFRLGKRGEKPRPVKVTCRIASQRSDILRKAPRIRNLSKNLGFQRTYVKPDLSPKEQEANWLLRKELAERRKAGENVMIRGGRIVVRQPLQSIRDD